MEQIRTLQEKLLIIFLHETLNAQPLPGEEDGSKCGAALSEVKTHCSSTKQSSTIVLLQQVKDVLLMCTELEDWDTYCSAGLSLLAREPLQHGSASDLHADKQTHSIINLPLPLWLLLPHTIQAVSSFCHHWES